MDIVDKINLYERLDRLCKEYGSQDFVAWTHYPASEKLEVIEIFGSGDRTIAKFSLYNKIDAVKAAILWLENEMKEE